MDIRCNKCGEENSKSGKITGIAAVQSLDSRTGLGGSDLLITFCSKCGNVIEMKVANPEKIK